VWLNVRRKLDRERAEYILLQVGEEMLVLEIGQAALQRPDSKPYDHDMLLAMALAEVRSHKNMKKNSCIIESF
jgi:hypothetical protein